MSHTDTEQTVPVETINRGEFVKRKAAANREVFVKKGTMLFVGFSY